MSDIRRDLVDLNFWNTDQSTEPPVMVRGMAGKDSTGTWRYLSVSANGALSQMALGGALATGQVSIASAAATQIVAPNGSRTQGVAITNNSTQTIYLGTSAVTTSTGLYLAPNPGTTLILPTTSAVYGIVSATGQTVSYLEI